VKGGWVESVKGGLVDNVWREDGSWKGEGGGGVVRVRASRRLKG